MLNQTAINMRLAKIQDTAWKEAPDDVKISGDWFTVPNRIVKEIK